MRRRDFMILLLSYIFSGATPISMAKQGRPTNGRTCVVLDDAGSSKTSIISLEKLASSQVPASIAVLPKSYLEKQALDILADYANADVLLHQPMEPIDMKRNKPEEQVRLKGKEYNPKIHSGIYHFDSRDLAYRIVKDNAELLNRYLDKKGHKGIIGMNNHMGSLVTQDKKLMEAVCQYALEKKMIVIDSRTTNQSILYKTAIQMNVNAYSNRCFIDIETEKKLNNLLTINKDIIAIGHLQNKETVDTYIGMAKKHRFSRISELPS